MSTLDDMQNRYQIEQVLRRYCRGVDRGDAQLIASAYHNNASDDHGSFKGSGREFADHLVAATKDRWLASQHLLNQTNIEFAGDIAWVETYFTAHHRLLDEQGATMLETFGGRYVDRFEQHNHRWAISHRSVVYDWSQIQKVGEEYPHQDFELGKRSKEDLSYKRH